MLSIHEPQQEVIAELRGLGEPRDVTHAHAIASVAPASMAVGGGGQEPHPGTRATLLFLESGPGRRLLGKLELAVTHSVQRHSGLVCCMRIAKAASYCMPNLRLQVHYLHWAYVRRRNPPAVSVSTLDARALAALFIVPRPVALVSVGNAETGNLLPMNLMGSVGEDGFGFALNSSRGAARAVKRHMRVAICTVPFDYADTARSLGPHHLRDRIDWSELPFALGKSRKFELPIPAFAQRVRELEVETVEEMGSHSFFLARIVADDVLGDGPSFHVIHGHYQAWRDAHGLSGVR